MDRKITVLFLTFKWLSLNYQTDVSNFPLSKFLAQNLSFTVLEGKEDCVLLQR